VTTGAAEGSPRCVLLGGSVASGAAVTVSLLVVALWAGGWKVGGRPGGVYWVPAST
jgi:hypothetical protein